MMNCRLYLNVWRVCVPVLLYWMHKSSRMQALSLQYNLSNTTDYIFIALCCRLYFGSFMIKPTMQRLWDFLRFVVFFYLTGFLIFVFKNLGLYFLFFICLNSIKVKETGIQ